MDEWAIEALNLVKKFPRKKNKENGNEDGAPARKGFRLPFLKKKTEEKPEDKLFTAVDGVSLNIHRGEIFGLLGPNGAGKSTTIRMLCTLLEPTGGTAQVNGFDILKQADLVRQNLGTVLAGERSIYWKLTARENLEYFAALYHVPADVAKKRVKDLLARMELTNRADELVEKYSTGMRQRVAISKALVANPPILLLDEPTLGLDPQAARNLRELIATLKEEGHTILLTTHYMEEADQLSDRIGIIDQGKIVALDTPTRLKETIQQKDVIRMEVSGWYEALSTKIQTVPGIESLLARRMEGDGLYEISLHAQNSRAVLPGIIDSINSNGTHLVNMNIVRPSLEDVFINLTGKALRD